MRPAGRGVGVARMSPSRLLAFLFDDLFAFADTFDMRGSFRRGARVSIIPAG